MDLMDSDEIIQSEENTRKSREHIVDSINLLLFTSLLILVVLTVWLFKYKKVSFVHETGLAIFYGLICGIIIRYGIKTTKKRAILLKADNLSLNHVDDLPEFVYLAFANSSEKFVYTYKAPMINDELLNDDYEEKATFDPETFFNILLPPIIFYAGYGMKRKHFFKNFGAILLFSMLGTAISCFAIGGLVYATVSTMSSIRDYFTFTDCLLFGALISATDPVTTLAIFNDQNVDLDLYSIVFGESVLNDAVSIILAQQIEKYGLTNSEVFSASKFFKAIGSFFKIFIGAFLIGSSTAFLNALLTKFTQIRQHPGLETALFILISYSTFLASEAVGFTGIVAVLFCGVFQAHYTYNNLSAESQKQTRHIFHLLSFLSENFIFVYIGVSMFTFRNHHWEASFIFASFFAIFVARALNVYPLSFLINLTRPKHRKIELNMQHLLFFSGLRGAMAFGLAIRNTATNSRQLILTTTSIIVVVTVIFCGGLTRKMVEWLEIRSAKEDSETEDKQLDKKKNRKFLDEMEQKNNLLKKIISKFGIFQAWHGFDKRFMKPFLTHSRPTLIDTMPKRMLPLARLLTTKEQLQENYSSGNKNPLGENDDNDERLNQANLENQEVIDIQMDQVLIDN